MFVLVMCIQEVQVLVEGQSLEAVAPHSELLCACCVILETSLVFTATQTHTQEGIR